ncbi:hypothetical protein [uncultured Kordia sp.]|uniref:hypothetical protein n=1 Tax=uncultured Kordia sp. TaxID=507699 RepID=UPI0026306D1A|nr:hypothetical protein [uncultured Kordia sp.]
MKKRKSNSLTFKKVTVSNFLIGGVYRPSDHACASAVSCESICFCVPATETCNCEDQAPGKTVHCDGPAG